MGGRCNEACLVDAEVVKTTRGAGREESEWAGSGSNGDVVDPDVVARALWHGRSALKFGAVTEGTVWRKPRASPGGAAVAHDAVAVRVARNVVGMLEVDLVQGDLARRVGAAKGTEVTSGTTDVVGRVACPRQCLVEPAVLGRGRFQLFLCSCQFSSDRWLE